MNQVTKPAPVAPLRQKGYLYLATKSPLRLGFYLEWFLILAVFTVSFDIFMNVKIGFNFRFTQLSVIAGLVVFVFTKRNLRLVLPLGFNLLLVWFGFILLFVPNGFLVRNVGYAAWLFFNIITIVLVVQHIDTLDKLVWIYRMYIASFVFVSLFGIFQFFAPWVGLSPFISQWWVYGLIPRVSGFSYEPSYYATYLLMGWIITAYLLYNNRDQQSKRWLVPHLGLIHAIITLAIVLSSSRMGLLMLGIWFLQYPLKLLRSVYRLRLKKNLLWINVALALLAGAALLLVISINFAIIIRLLEGTGLFGSSAHSAERFPLILEVLSAFANSPIIGYSLGGVANAIAELRGAHITDLAQLKLHEGLNVFAEVLAASGIVGFVPFVLYVFTLFYSPLRALKRISQPELRLIVVTLLIALAFEFLILQLNQNILRPYLWLHIALVSAAYRVTKKEQFL